MRQDRLDHGPLLDRGQQTQPPAAVGAGENVNREYAAQQVSPGEIAQERELPSYRWAADEDPLGRRTMEAIASGVATQKYPRVLDRLPWGRARE